jgi:hypothetical protein
MHLTRRTPRPGTSVWPAFDRRRARPPLTRRTRRKPAAGGSGGHVAVTNTLIGIDRLSPPIGSRGGTAGAGDSEAHYRRSCKCFTRCRDPLARMHAWCCSGRVEVDSGGDNVAGTGSASPLPTAAGNRSKKGTSYHKCLDLGLVQIARGQLPIPGRCYKRGTPPCCRGELFFCFAHGHVTAGCAIKLPTRRWLSP